MNPMPLSFTRRLCGLAFATIAWAAGTFSLAASPAPAVSGNSPGTPAAAGAPRGDGESRGEQQAAQQFKWLDANHDGYLSREEVALFPRLRDAFDQADANHDGRVSFDEIRAFALRHRAERQQQTPAAGAGPAAAVPPTGAAPRP